MATKALPAVQHAGSSCRCHRWISAPGLASHTRIHIARSLATQLTTKFGAVFSSRCIRSAYAISMTWNEVHPKSDHTSTRHCFTSSKSRMRFWYTRSNGFRSGLLGGQRSGDMNSGVNSGADIRRWHVHDEPAHRTAGTLPWQLLQLVLRCINNFYGKL